MDNMNAMANDAIQSLDYSDTTTKYRTSNSPLARTTYYPLGPSGD